MQKENGKIFDSYQKLTRAELQMLFRGSFGKELLDWSIAKGYKKLDYIRKLREREQYDWMSEENKKRLREKWRKENEELLATIERFL